MRMEKHKEIHAKREEMVGRGVPERMVELLLSTEQTLADAEERLMDLADTIERRLDTVRNRIAEGHHVNSLGELQSAGLNFDQQCSVRQALVEQRNRITYVINKEWAAN